MASTPSNYRVADDLTAAVFVPDYELSTEKARQALPGKVAFKDAVHNVSRVSLLPAAMNPGMLALGRRRTPMRCCTPPRRIDCTNRIVHR